MYQDRMDIYREVFGTDGNATGYHLLYSAVPCQFHRTPNYDTHKSAGGQSKMDNMFTSNKITCQYEVDIKDGDMVFVTTRRGDSEWQAVIGAPMKRIVIKHSKFFGNPTQAPVIV